MANENYFLGLDIGTDSVGWAVTNEQYELKKFKNNLMWGVHLFDEANQSADRRMFRTSRRRLDRRQQRITLLQEFFAIPISKADEKFFLRLKESALMPEDAENRKNNIYFDDENYSDKDYFSEYPTIHHLICELMDNPSPHDVRLVYLACAYILSHRGHFLFSVPTDNIEKITDFEPVYNEFYDALEEVCGNVPFDKNQEGFSEILKSHKSVTEKDKELNVFLFGRKFKRTDNEFRFDLMTKLISGGTVKLSELFDKDEYKELEKDSICVRNADFSDTLETLEGQLDEMHFTLISKIKALNDWALLVDILDGHTMISKAKVEIYDEHKKDLKDLKKIFRTYFTKKEYNEVFRDVSDKPNYVSYVYNASSDKSRDKYKKCSQEDFCKFVLGYLKDVSIIEEDKECYDRILNKCKTNSLCPKQVTTDNRVIPYQLYYAELKKILENAGEYLPFLNEKDEYGTVADKILEMMKFRIPYYVGPLVNNNNKNAWIVRKAEGRITPWNFDEMVDKDKTEKEFIRRMTCKCTYLAGEDVLPKYSLLYCKFNVLNEINNIMVNGLPVSTETKQSLYNELFVRQKSRVTKKRIREFLVSKNLADKNSVITGVDDVLKSSLKSYHDFRILIENGVLKESEVENIIERITVSTDKERLKGWLKAEYPQLTKDDIRYISKLNYKDYGRLSRRFLEELYPFDKKTGEVISDRNIITMLWETNENLMKLLSSGYGYSDALELKNKEYYDLPENKKNIDERLKEMYIPTAVRRSVTRTLDIVRELKSIMKTSPEKIFIEMARGTSDISKGQRTKSRRQQITELLDGSDADNIEELKVQLDKSDDGKLRSEKYYLYFMQLGKCMYTGKSINFDELEDNHKWNIDHIWPQAKIKDDSIDNKVLVDSTANGEKSDTYPINYNIRHNMSGTWYSLYKKGLISEKKYQRLIRNTPFTDEELSGFIARQLVETRQSTKAVATLLKEYFPESEIVYVKAELASDFRKETGMLKCREVNDLHHAKDAYLNIVLGNVYNTKFTKDPLNFVKSKEQYSLKMFKKDSNGKESGLLTRKVERNGKVAWDPDTSFEVVRKMMSRNSIRYVRYCYKRKSGQNGGFFDQNPLRKGKGMVPIKKDLSIAKYGGFDNATISYFSLALIKGKGAVLVGVELLCSDKFANSVDFAKEYIANKMSYELKSHIVSDDITFPLNKRIIKINTVIELDGYRVQIAAKQNSSIKFVSIESLILEQKYVTYIKRINSSLEKIKNEKNYSISQNSLFNAKDNEQLFDILVKKCMSNPFSKMYEDIGITMLKHKKDFTGYSMVEQLKILSEMVRLLKTGRKTGVDLTMIGGKSKSGIKTINACLFKIKNYNSIQIIDQSPTGLYEKKSANLLEL